MKHRGFIDLHTHGMGGYDTRTGRAEDILKFSGLQRKAGVSAILPTIYAASIKEMRRNMNAVREAGNKDGSIMGVYLEGPFLNPARSGALDRRAFLRPTVPDLKKLLDGFEDIVKIITIAPELPNALRVIEKCVSLGIRVNMGHSDATFKQALRGKRAGASGITHLFNAMRPMHHREPGLAGFGLLDEDLYVEVIADGVHLHPECLRLVFSVKRKDRIILVSDSIKGPIHKSGSATPESGSATPDKGMYKKGILQGGKASIPQALRLLGNIGIPEQWAIRAAMDNPRRYLKGQ